MQMHGCVDDTRLVLFYHDLVGDKLETRHPPVCQRCLTLSDPMDCSLPGSSIHGIFQARMLEWLPFPTLGDLPDPGIEPMNFMHWQAGSL